MSIMKAIFGEKNILTQNRARPFQKGRFRHASRERNSIPFFLSGQKFPTANLSERYQIKIKKIIFLKRLSVLACTEHHENQYTG